jgi:cytochrome b
MKNVQEGLGFIVINCIRRRSLKEFAMQVFARLRLYHAAIGLLAITAYLTQDLERVHVWIGYTIAGLLATRIVLAVVAPRALTSPHWLIRRQDLTFAKGLQSPIIGKVILAGIMACFAVVIATGVMMDQKLAVRADLITVTTAHADERASSRDRSKPNKVVKEIHEVTANVLFVIVGFHIGYLLLRRRQYALSMIYLGARAKPL